MVEYGLPFLIGAGIGYFVYKWITIQVKKRTDKLHNNIHNKLNGDDDNGNRNY